MSGPRPLGSRPGGVPLNRSALCCLAVPGPAAIEADLPQADGHLTLIEHPEQLVESVRRVASS